MIMKGGGTWEKMEDSLWDKAKKKLFAPFIAAGIGLASALEPQRKITPAAPRYEELEESEFQRTMQRLLAQEYQLTRPRWMGKPRLSVAQMMAKYHGGATGLVLKVNERELAQLAKEIPRMPLTSVRYDDNMNPTFYRADGTKIYGDGSELSGETKTFDEDKK